MIPSANDVYLGWGREPHGRDYYVRQRSQGMNITAELSSFDADVLENLRRAATAPSARPPHPIAVQAPLDPG